MSPLPAVSTPTTFVVFGATGDLFARKIIPSLYLLYCEKKIPAVFSVIGFGRQAHTTETFREYIFIQLKSVVPEVTMHGVTPFLELFEYHQGEFNDSASFEALGEKLRLRDGNCLCDTVKSFYLAVPPQLVRTLAPHISEVVPKNTSTRRIIIEKPFGHDEQSARELNTYLHTFFEEEELFRIDHYLAKPALDTLLHSRTTYHTYETLLHKEPVKAITITLFETLGVEKRGAFFDGVGAFRDVGQNHLLEMLALAVMKLPVLSPQAICLAREHFMKSLPLLSPEEVAAQTIRAQYEGYRNISGVDPTSNTETYFEVSFRLSHGPFKNVPVTLRSGKRMKRVQKDIVIYFDCEHTDSLHIELEPLPRLFTKKGALVTPLIEFQDPDMHIQYANEYAMLFLHAWLGDPTLFPTEKEVEYAWRFTDPIVKTWATGVPSLKTYAQHTEVE